MSKRYSQPQARLYHCPPSLLTTFTHGTVDGNPEIGTEEGNPEEILAKPNRIWDDDEDDANHKHDTL